MLASLLLVSTLAHASEVGTTKKFGAGATTGWPFIQGTVKYYLDEKSGIAGFVGIGSWAGLDLRVQYEREITDFHEWDFGRLGMNWLAGGYLESVWYYGGFAPGAYGGANAYLKFNDVPAEVFSGPSLGVGYFTYAGAPYLMVFWDLGGRWYF
jgi:hypothetical protein